MVSSETVHLQDVGMGRAAVVGYVKRKVYEGIGVQDSVGCRGNLAVVHAFFCGNGFDCAVGVDSKCSFVAVGPIVWSAVVHRKVYHGTVCGSGNLNGLRFVVSAAARSKGWLGHGFQRFLFPHNQREVVNAVIYTS